MIGQWLTGENAANGKGATLFCAHQTVVGHTHHYNSARAVAEDWSTLHDSEKESCITTLGTPIGLWRRLRAFVDGGIYEARGHIPATCAVSCDECAPPPSSEECHDLTHLVATLGTKRPAVSRFVLSSCQQQPGMTAVQDHSPS